MRKAKLLLAAMLCIVGIGLAKADVITDVSQLSNSKAYTVVTGRGAWWADLSNNRMHYNGNITNAANVPDDANYKFAIIKQGEFFFLYSIGAEKFVNPQKYFTTIMPTPLTVSNLSGGKLKMTSSNPNKAINIGGSQWTWDGWTTTDDGNTLTISEVGDFDPTTALAMLTTKVYTVSCGRGSWAVTSDHTALTAHNASNASSNDADKQFALFVNEGKMYLYSVGAEKFVKSNGSLFDGKGDPIAYNSTNDSSYPYHFYFALADQIYFNLQDGAGSIVFNTWSGQDAGSKYQIASATGADVEAITAKATEVFYGSQTITYTIKINGNTVATETREHKVGEQASLTSTYTGKEFVTYSYSPSTIEVGTTDVEVTATVSGLPFEISTDYDNAKWYNLRINQTKRYVGKEANEPYHTYAEADISEVTRASTAYQWAFMGNPVSGIKVINKETGANYSLTVDGTGDNVNGSPDIPNTVLRAGNHYWDVHQNGEGFSLNLIGKSNYYINTHGGSTGYFQIWQSSGARTDGGSRLTVAEVPDLETTVTYNVSYNGNVVHTEKAYGVVGTPLGALPSNINRDYVSITGFNGETEVTRDMTVDLTATWTGPFDLSDSYESAHWYNMAVRGDYYVTSDNKSSDDALAPVPANAIGLVEDAYQWAFVGDPWHIKLYNKAEGDSKVYAWTSNENSSIPAFVDAASAKAWLIKASTSGIVNAFMLTTDLGYQTNQFGGATGSLKIWAETKLSDPGSAFKAFNVPSNFAEFVTAEISPYFDNTAKYFVFSDAARAEIGYDESYKTECPYATYKSMKEKLTAEFVDDISNYALPETGYYLLKNKNYGTYMGIDPSDANLYGNYETATAAKQIVKLTKTGAATYTISLMGKFAPASVAQSAQVTATAEAGTYTVVISTFGSAAFQADPEVNMSCLHCAGGGSIVGWEAVAAASQWIAEDATSIELAVGAAGYATTYLPFPVAIPENVKAYTGEFEETWLKLNEVEGTIPTKTPVVLNAPAATYTFNIAAEADAITNNVLKGTLEPIEAAGKYVLAKPEADEDSPAGYDIGFYLGKSGTIAAGKAYLDLGGTSTVKGFTFVFDDDDATAIDEIVNGKSTNSKCYNIAGQRISKMQKGINIVNGKMILK